MNREEARRILHKEVDAFRAKPFQELAALIGSPVQLERTASDGANYQIEIEAFRDDPRNPGGDIRVIGPSTMAV